MISASKNTFRHYNLKILRPKVTKNLKNFRKNFCESLYLKNCWNNKLRGLEKESFVDSDKDENGNDDREVAH